MKNRIVKLDIARTFAILCVILCHCSEMTYFNDMVVLKNLKITSRIFMMGTFTIGRFGVSIFLYLSGVLLLRKVIEKDEDIENNRYALAYAASKYFNTTETGNKQVDKYILQMQQKYDKII